MKPVDDKVVNDIQSKARGSKIFSDDNIQTLRNNPNQWYEMASVVGDENYTRTMASYVSSARYFRDRLKGTENLELEFKSSQSRTDKSARLYARVIGDTNNGIS
tara:strand:+ start:67 stop:378 length:312 start_codon:yes stop_codon:yes gene_type:complete